MICAGLDMITPVPIERWDNELYYDPDTSAPGKMSLAGLSWEGLTAVNHLVDWSSSILTVHRFRENAGAFSM